MLLGSEFATLPVICEELLVGQARNRVNFVNLKDKVITPQNNRNLSHALLHIWSKFHNPSLRAMVNFHMKPQYSPILRIER